MPHVMLPWKKEHVSFSVPYAHVPLRDSLEVRIVHQKNALLSRVLLCAAAGMNGWLRAALSAGATVAAVAAVGLLRGSGNTSLIPGDAVTRVGCLIEIAISVVEIRPESFLYSTFELHSSRNVLSSCACRMGLHI